MQAIIPARGGSKGIHRKNLVEIAGKPLFVWSVLQALEAGLYPVVTSDDQEIKDIARDYGADVIDRPLYLGTDTAYTINVIKHCYKCGAVSGTALLLQPTSPLRIAEDIKLAVRLYKTGFYDSVFSGYENKSFLRDENGKLINVKRRMRRQEMESQYVENGSIYVFSEDILKQNDFIFGRSTVCVMPFLRSIEIDTTGDLELCQALMKR